MELSPSLEIRKLPHRYKEALVQILEVQESWKKLMAIIPEGLLKDNYKCDVTFTNPALFRTEDFINLENLSMRRKKQCADLLLREWGTYDRVRPALGHLKYLLEKAELFRAADYVAVDILKQQPSQKPVKGPAAPVLLNSDELKDVETTRIEKILDEINYPSSAIANINKLNSIDTNINHSIKESAVKVIPKIIIHESPDAEERAPVFSLPIVTQRDRTHSDLIKFSTASVSSDDDNAFLPNLSSLLENTSDNIPVVVQDLNESFDAMRPNLSSLLDDCTEPAAVLPDLSELNMTDSSSNFYTDSSDSKNSLPAFSQLLEQKSSKVSRTCSSPLPNLSLNTPLPHVSYGELERATNEFDETPLFEGGRFLGSGAFGKVYLALGVFEKPIAVKKVLLENEEVVLVDDAVTKQFKNEVEILSKYQHENLLPLLGYSCDGATYCLLYEYVPGGAMKDRLQRHELIWTERLYIAMGTARAISYLHTAYSTPLIHRDVKSANILLDVTNKPKLCDFGLIKRTPSQYTNSATTIVGTSAYMAPEAFRGDISVKLDTFSFGVVLLELLTSLPPHDERREGVDLVTHVQDNCQDEIMPLLDTAVGSWMANDINFGQKLYEIAADCLKEKKGRPTMSVVSNILGELIKKSL